MNATLLVDGYVDVDPAVKTYGQGKESVEFTILHKQFAGTKWEKEVPFRLTAKGDKVKPSVLALAAGDFVTLSCHVVMWQSKNNPDYWNPQFEVVAVLARIGSTGEVEVAPMDPTHDDLPF